MPDQGYMDAAAVPVPDAGDDRLRDQVAKAVCSIAIGSERVETVMEIIQEHTAKAELRADARARVDEIKQRAAIEQARTLADVSSWHVYESQDTGDVYPADAVRDRMAEIRSALDQEATP